MRTWEARPGLGLRDRDLDWQARPGLQFQGPVPCAPGFSQTARQVSSWSHAPTRDELQSTSHWSSTNWSVISRVKMLTNFLHALVQSWDSASGQMASVPPTVWLSKGDFGVCVCVCEWERLYVCIEQCRSSESLCLKDALCMENMHLKITYKWLDQINLNRVEKVIWLLHIHSNAKCVSIYVQPDSQKQVILRNTSELHHLKIRTLGRPIIVCEILRSWDNPQQLALSYHLLTSDLTQVCADYPGAARKCVGKLHRSHWKTETSQKRSEREKKVKPKLNEKLLTYTSRAVWNIYYSESHREKRGGGG